VSLKAALIGLAIAVLAVIAGGIGGFLSHSYLEIWFDPVEGVQVTNLATWPKLADGLRATFDLTDPQSYRAYYGENAGDGVTEISTAKIVLRNLQLSGRLIGIKQKEVNGKTEVYSLSGYSNSERMVLVQRGRKGGIGNFFVQKTQDKDSNIFYFGYFLTEDYEPGAAEKTITQCPFVMMEESVAAARYPIAEKAHDKIGMLSSKCKQFQFPVWQTASP
jgi:hypothetical protein